MTSVPAKFEKTRVPIRKRAPSERVEDFGAFAAGYTVDEAVREALRCLLCKDPKCTASCPAHLDVVQFIRAVRERDIQWALEVIMDTFPLPATCGRVCFHPCEAACVHHKAKSDPVAVAWLRRFVADYGDELKAASRLAPPTGRRVAVIGAGPGGLSCAYHLTRKGHKVTVFEAASHPGGMLYYGIPSFRLEREVLLKEVKVLEDIGVEIRYNIRIGKDLAFDALLQQGYEAVFIATGAHRSMKLGIPGEELQGVLHGIEYLREHHLGHPPKLGDRIVVVGGGNTAMDVIRTVLREHPKELIHVYRRSAEELPAGWEEVVEAAEEIIGEELPAPLQAGAENKRAAMARLTAQPVEGPKTRVVVALLTQPVEVLAENGAVAGLKCIRMELGPPDESGRRSPVPVPNSEFTLPADTVIAAIGERVDLSFLGERPGLSLDPKWKTIVVDKETMATNVPGVFAGGDVVSGPLSMVAAMGDGKRAAVAIDAYLSAHAKVPAASQAEGAPSNSLITPLPT